MPRKKVLYSKSLYDAQQQYGPCKDLLRRNINRLNAAIVQVLRESLHLRDLKPNGIVSARLTARFPYIYMHL